MQNLRELPSSDATYVEHADWVEITTLFKNGGDTSREDLARALKRSGFVTEDRARILAEEAFNELKDRQQLAESCPEIAKYPFELVDNDDVLRRKQKSTNPADGGVVYLFLLAITRGSMHSTHRTLGGIDPTKVFEKLCADVLINFWGGRSAVSDVLIVGTARRNGRRHFPTEIETLCNKLGEGGGWKKGARSPGAGDGSLDIAAWRRFPDKRRGGLVGFAQCKTGIHWREYLTKLKPEAFCGNYMREPLLLAPLAMYMVPCRVEYDRWDSDVRLGGLLFDRCRITQYSTDIPEERLDECRVWLDAALEDTRKHKP